MTRIIGYNNTAFFASSPNFSIKLANPFVALRTVYTFKRFVPDQVHHAYHLCQTLDFYKSYPRFSSHLASYFLAVLLILHLIVRKKKPTKFLFPIHSSLSSRSSYLYYMKKHAVSQYFIKSSRILLGIFVYTIVKYSTKGNEDYARMGLVRRAQNTNKAND